MAVESARLASSKEEFINYCLRALGSPVVEVNVTREQIEDRIKEALLLYFDYHYDGSEVTYYKRQLTQTDINNKYIDMPENILGVVQLFDINSSLGTNNMFSIQYQMALNDFFDLASSSLVPYVMARQRVSMMQEILVGKPPIRYRRHINRLYIDMDWTKVKEGDWLVVEAHRVIDPATYTKVWSDRWLAQYATALIKKQWGTNLSKFGDVTLVGGVTIKGSTIAADGKNEADALEKELEGLRLWPIGFFA